MSTRFFFSIYEFSQMMLLLSKVSEFEGVRGPEFTEV